GIIILYVYSGTFNFIDLYRTAGIWFRSMAANPGTIMLLSILMLGGPISKSAQFPLHEWLPEAMAGPTPVSALIHAATMVKAGVYFVARILPLFFYAYWMLNYPEAGVFFTLTAAIGAFTAFLAGTQAMVSLELKKALAYSTMSQIGYMMLALGVSGLNADALALGVSAGIFHLISHGIFKAALFLCAGVLIHISGSIYMHRMSIDRRNMPLTWLFMWIASLSLIGVPPLSGFWSKDKILVSCLESGQPLIFIVALITVAITSFYTARMMGMTFHSGERRTENKRLEANLLMLIPYGLLAALTVILGLMGPWIGDFLKGTFRRYYAEHYGLAFSDAVSRSIHGDMTSIVIPAASILMIAIGFVPAHKLYVSRRLKPEEILRRHVFLHKLHGFLWNRWYIDPFYNRVLVRGMLRLRRPLVKFIEDPIDFTFNIGVPKLFIFSSRNLRKFQTGVLSINMLYLLAFSAIITITLWLVML
ncbi:NADH-quinone oxidoreductase subunit L, partial [Candidatus Bathyarchaeota archaeon]